MKRRTLLLLLLASRLSLLAFWPPDRLACWSDYDYYYRLASWVDQGRLPYLHYWVEFPPLFPYLSVLVYLVAPRYESYVTALALVQLFFETGSLLLLLRIARCALGDAQAERIGWTYALLFAPVAAWWLSYDAVPTFFLLLAVERWLAGRRTQSALATGIGGLVKWFPLLFLPVALRFRKSWREAILYAGTVLLVVAMAFGVLAALSPAYTLASLASLGQRASWQTIWALLDGNLGTGAYQANRLDPSAATLPQGNPSVVPTWVTTLAFGALYAWLWLRPSQDGKLWLRPSQDGNLWLRSPGDGEPRQVLRLTALTVVIFFLWSRGWSPQWVSMLAPLLLLALPLERAVLYAIVLTLVSIAEWPVLLSRGMNGWLYLTVPLRTGLFVLLGVDLWRKVTATGTAPTR